MTRQVAFQSGGQIVGKGSLGLAAAAVRAGARRQRKHTKASNLLALRAVCCKIAVGAQSALSAAACHTLAICGFRNFPREGDRLICCTSSVSVRSRISG